MDVFTMVVLIVIVVFGSGIVRVYLRDRREQRTESVDSGVLEELDALRQRVAVLEEIVTDGKYQLNRELDRLEREPAAGGPDNR